MVKLGFIVEGASEKTILESDSFRDLLTRLNIDFIEDVIDAQGAGKLLPHNRVEFVQKQKDRGATHILYLCDKEDAPCISSVKDRVQPGINEFFVLCIQAIEAWYLADNTLMSSLFKTNYQYADPQSTLSTPLETLHAEFIQHTGRGFSSSKPILARRMVREGFSIERAAEHPNCSSARYFIDKLKAISKLA